MQVVTLVITALPRRRLCIIHPVQVWTRQVRDLTTFSVTEILTPSLGNVYIADTFNHRIRKVTVSTGIITTIAGTGSTSYSGDNGQATSAALNYPVGIALDSAGTPHRLLISI